MAFKQLPRSVNIKGFMKTVENLWSGISCCGIVDCYSHYTSLYNTYIRTSIQYKRSIQIVSLLFSLLLLLVFLFSKLNKTFLGYIDRRYITFYNHNTYFLRVTWLMFLLKQQHCCRPIVMYIMMVFAGILRIIWMRTSWKVCGPCVDSTSLGGPTSR